MSVLDRKMFKKVAKLKHGGNPLIDHETGNVKEANQLTGIVQGMADFQPFVDVMAETLYPSKDRTTLQQEGTALFGTDLSSQRELIEQQKKEDVGSALINFGTRLASGRGNNLTILAEAAQATLPEFTAARRATRKEEAALSLAEQQQRKQIAQYVLTQEQQNRVNQANLKTQAIFNNLGFFQDIAKANYQKKLDATTQLIDLVDTRTGNLTKVTVADYLEDANKPIGERVYASEQDFDEPMYVYDSVLNDNVFFTSRAEFAEANQKNPQRYKKERNNTTDPFKEVTNILTGQIEYKRESELDPRIHFPRTNFEYQEVYDTVERKQVFLPKNVPFDTNRYVPEPDPVTVKRTFFAQYTDPISGDLIQDQVQELTSGEFRIRTRNSDGDIVLQTNGNPMWKPSGAVTDLVPMSDVEVSEEAIFKPKQKLEIFGKIQGTETSLKAIDKVLFNLAEDPTRAGIVGSVKNAIQIGKGMIVDLISAEDQDTIFRSIAQDIKNTYEGTDQYEEFQRMLDAEYQTANGKDVFGDNFDPAFAQNKVLVNAIAYAVARARKTSGRLNLDDVRNARETLQISGFTSADQVTAGLSAVRDELLDYRTNLNQQFELVGGTFPSSYVPYNANTSSNQEILPYLKEGGDIGIRWSEASDL
tara:strand:+ start:989 stop:2926 length:1938 start_codon:yes stop_codon:yes gene_type:complete